MPIVLVRRIVEIIDILASLYEIALKYRKSLSASNIPTAGIVARHFRGVESNFRAMRQAIRYMKHIPPMNQNSTVSGGIDNFCSRSLSYSALAEPKSVARIAKIMDGVLNEKPSRFVANENAMQPAKVMAKPTVCKTVGHSLKNRIATRVVQIGPVARIGPIIVTGKVLSAQYAKDQLAPTIADFAARSRKVFESIAIVAPSSPRKARVAITDKKPLALVIKRTSNARLPFTLCFLQISYNESVTADEIINASQPITARYYTKFRGEAQ